MSTIHQYKSTVHREKYFHMRREQDTDIAFPANINAATVFARKEADNDWYFSVSFCSTHDNFCRKTGRSVARRRYFTGNKYCIGPSEPFAGDLAINAESVMTVVFGT